MWWRYVAASRWKTPVDDMNRVFYFSLGPLISRLGRRVDSVSYLLPNTSYIVIRSRVPFISLLVRLRVLSKNLSHIVRDEGSFGLEPGLAWRCTWWVYAWVKNLEYSTSTCREWRRILRTTTYCIFLPRNHRNLACFKYFWMFQFGKSLNVSN